MFRSLKLGLLLGASLLVAGAMATSAAYVTVNIDRPASAQLAADNANNAAVKITCLDNTAGSGPNYGPLCTYDTAGSVTIALEKALKADGTIFFNRNASFTVGAQTTNNRVVSITNYTQDEVKVYFNSTTGISMYSQDGTALSAAPAGTSDAIGPGLTREYYFTLTTPDTNTAALTGTVQIR
ncbi:MAG: hypothetical protein ACM3XM_08885 [Mycobacterium leprae]